LGLAVGAVLDLQQDQMAEQAVSVICRSILRSAVAAAVEATDRARQEETVEAEEVREDSLVKRLDQAQAARASAEAVPAQTQTHIEAQAVVVLIMQETTATQAAATVEMDWSFPTITNTQVVAAVDQPQVHRAAVVVLLVEAAATESIQQD